MELKANSTAGQRPSDQVTTGGPDRGSEGTWTLGGNINKVTRGIAGAESDAKCASNSESLGDYVNQNQMNRSQAHQTVP